VLRVARLHHTQAGFLPRSSLRRFSLVRYNISENDSGNLIRFSGVPTNTQIYNNTFYAKPTMDNRRVPGDPPRILYHKDWQGWSDGVEFTNNIIYNDCPQAVYEFGQSRNNRWSHNLFSATHPASEPGDAAKVTADPLFAGNPGTADRGRGSAIAVYYWKETGFCWGWVGWGLGGGAEEKPRRPP